MLGTEKIDKQAARLLYLLSLHKVPLNKSEILFIMGWASAYLRQPLERLRRLQFVRGEMVPYEWAQAQSRADPMLQEKCYAVTPTGYAYLGSGEAQRFLRVVGRLLP